MEEIKVTVVLKRGCLYMRHRFQADGIGKDGKPKFKENLRAVNTKVRRDAERMAAKWEAELRDGKYKPVTKMAWEEFRKKYEDEVLSGLAEGTEGNKSTAMNHVERIINPALVSDMTTAKLSAFVGKLRAEKMKETTLKGMLAHLKPILQWGHRQGYLRIMPEMPATKRGKGITKVMRGRPITGEELDRMIAKVPDVRKFEPEKWKTLLNGLNLSGLRLGEALSLSWDNGASISVDTSGKYPALRVTAQGQKSHKDELLPLAPEFADFLLAVPEADRKGLVFGIYGKGAEPLSTKRASRYVAKIGRAAKVVTNKAEDRYATAHDLRRTFGSRWARKLQPAILQRLMRHSSIKTTMSYYVDFAAEDIGDMLRNDGSGDQMGDQAPKSSKLEGLKTS